MTTERSVCFTEDEAFDILWELARRLDTRHRRAPSLTRCASGR
jgi:hypothetical protein